MSTAKTEYNPDLYLSPNQEDLLLASLSSNNSITNNSNINQSRTKNSSTGQSHPKSTSPINSHQSNMGNGQFFDSPAQQTPSSGHFHPNDDSPFLDYEDGDGSFDFDFNGADMIGAIPGEEDISNVEEHDLHDKRKSIDGKTDDDEGGGKRRESEDKMAKKPGRKPLTSEPTSKRKAQNRAAQRAFRERKEKHLKDLETKVDDLEKASESANHENGLLKAQVERLTIELREYRKRLSFIGNTNSGASRSPTATANHYRSSRDSLQNTDFQFEFPKFGDLPGAHIFNNGSFAKADPENKSAKTTQSKNSANNGIPGVINRNSVPGTTPKGQTPSRGSTGGTPAPNPGVVNSSSNTFSNTRQATGIDSLSELFSPSILESVSRNSSLDFMSHPGSSGTLNQTSLAQANKVNHSAAQIQTHGSSSVSTSDSPSASSESQQGATSSMGTSPEPCLNSPSTGKLNDLGLNTISEEHAAQDNLGGENEFCKRLSQACGTCQNPIPRAMSQSNGRDAAGPAKTPGSEVNGIDWFAQQNGGQFDPVLFGGYRESQDAIAGQDFGSFFNDAFPLPDLGSPFNHFGAELSPPAFAPSPAPRRDLLQEIENKQNGIDEEVVPADKTKMLTCNKIWDRLQSMDSFQSGEIDMDNLCSELRTKAKCSETGAVVGEKDVEDILKRARAMQNA